MGPSSRIRAAAVVVVLTVVIWHSSSIAPAAFSYQETRANAGKLGKGHGAGAAATVKKANVAAYMDAYRAAALAANAAYMRGWRKNGHSNATRSYANKSLK